MTLSDAFGVVGEAQPHVESFVGRLHEVQAEDILPKTGVHLGLDVSTSSTGIAVWDMGSLTWGVVSLGTDKNAQHGEALMRRELRSELNSMFRGWSFDTIIIEDAFIGSQLQGVRWLFALNTVIDDMILDGDISCKTFVRVGNTTWKSWLRKTDPSKTVTGYNDKEIIKRLLSKLGVPTEVKQDQLDALGLLVGFFAQELSIGGQPRVGTKKMGTLVPLKNVKAVYCPTADELEPHLPDGYRREVFEDRISVSKIREAATHEPDVVWFTKKQVSLGNIVEKLGVDPIPFGGYVAFWNRKGLPQ